MSYVQRYQKRISGPLMECINIHLDVMHAPFEKFGIEGSIRITSQVPSRHLRRFSHLN